MTTAPPWSTRSVHPGWPAPSCYCQHCRFSVSCLRCPKVSIDLDSRVSFRTPIVNAAFTIAMIHWALQ